MALSTRTLIALIVALIGVVIYNYSGSEEPRQRYGRGVPYKRGTTTTDSDVSTSAKTSPARAQSIAPSKAAASPAASKAAVKANASPATSKAAASAVKVNASPAASKAAASAVKANASPATSKAATSAVKVNASPATSAAAPSAVASSTSTSSSAPPIIPVQPAAYPDPDETLMITGSYLTDSTITSALNYINSVVPASLLNIPVSTYIEYSTVTYTGNTSSTCYWPYDTCTRTTSGSWGDADLVYCPGQNMWGLTYDDAPSVNLVNNQHVNDTYSIISSLSQLNLKATFFVTGSQATYYPDAVVAIATAGHHIAHHTWSHHPLTSLTNAQIVAELMYTQAIVYNLTGLSMKYFRPPYGDIDDRVRAIANTLGFKVVLWDSTYDSYDSDVTANDAGYVEVMGRITSWFNQAKSFIGLQHTINTFSSGTSVAALNQIIAQGGVTNQMMPVPQCFGDVNWYKNQQVTTVYNSCTKTAGCSGIVTTGTSTTSSSSSSSAASSSTTVNISPDGSCGGTGSYICDVGQCCSQYGYCGNGTDFCDAGCQAQYSDSKTCSH